MGGEGSRERKCRAACGPIVDHLTTMVDPKTAAHDNTSPEPTPAVTRVLVVDDNKDAALMLGLLLREMGYEVWATNHVMDGLGWAHKAHPEVVLLDLQMPGIDGYETCRLLRTSKWGARATVVAVTGHAEPEDRARSKEAGFDYHLAKPIDRALLFSVLNVAAADRADGPQ